MSNEEIIKGNKLIAEFMGAKFITGKELNQADDCFLFEGEAAIPISKHDYFTTWGLLMPVVEKICRTKIGDDVNTIAYAYPRTFGMIDEETGKIMVRLNGYFLNSADTLIEAAWKSVCEFIVFQNNQ